MTPEDHLDHLIEQRERGASRPLLLDAETRDGLDAAQRVMRLRSITVPAPFAQKLEGELRTRIRAQSTRELKKSGQLLALASTQGSTRPARSLKRQLWAAMLCLVAVLLVICAVILVSLPSLPGDPFYGLTQTGKHVQLHLSDDAQDRANEAIQQLQHSLSDLRTVVHDGRGDNDIQQALGAVADWTSTSQQEVATLDTTTEVPAIEQQLAQGIADEKDTLRLLLNQLDWSMKAAFTHQLGILGEQVPTVTMAKVHLLGTGSAQMILAGTNFSPQAQFLVDGKPLGSINQLTSHSLVVLISHADGLAGTHTVGILNPDGTAALTSITFPPAVKKTGTPLPSPTRRPDE